MALKATRIVLPYYQGLLAEIEIEGRGAAAALTGIDEAIALARATGERWVDAELHRIRGKILLKQNPADPAPAEEALLTAIATARAQKARSFELRAALSLAKLYRATGRDAEAHAVLGPALEGFAPTPEFPEIAEAKAIFDVLAQIETVKTAGASRLQRIHLQVSYGNALMAARGYTSPETRVAFEHARELLTGVEDVTERLSVNYGLWISSHVRGDLGAMRELAAAFFLDHAKSPDSGAASVANRIIGATQFFAGEFVEARANLEKAVSIFDPERESDLTIRFGHDIGISALGYSAFALWPLGEIDLARQRIEDLAARASKPGHALSAGVGFGLCAIFAMLGRDAVRAQPFVISLSKIGDEREMALAAVLSVSLEAWVAWRSEKGDAALASLRRGVARQQQGGIVVWAPIFETALAEAEAEGGRFDAAITTIDHVLAESARTGQQWHDAETYRVRGEILLKQNPYDPARAAEAFLTAIAIAQAQKARSFELRAALALAKLYRATGRDLDPHAVLGPALEGFAATSLLPTKGREPPPPPNAPPPPPC